jgi:multisubunit Na+/H+ antiporter MnhF subunit
MPFSSLIHSPTVQMIFIIGVAVCLLLLLVRFSIGPTSLDRLVALDSFAIVFLCLVAVWGVHIGTVWFYDLILMLSVVGFLSTIALARYFDQGSVDDD